MEIRFDPNSTVPIYLQIIYSIKHQVATGRLKPGEQLPTVRMLATDLRINPNTVARAYDTLDTESVITSQRGRGTYVREHPDEAHLRRVRKDQLKAMMDNVVNDALSLGYPAEEIKEAFEVELARWMRQRRSTPSSHDKRLADPDAKLVPHKA
jgi:GntR family transcriptional regulator